MVAGKNNDRILVIAHHLSGALQQFEGLAVIVECVPRQQDNVGAHFSCCSQNLGKHRQRIGVAEAVIYPEVQIRAVNDNRFWVRTHDQLIPEQVSFKLTNVTEKESRAEVWKRAVENDPFRGALGGNQLDTFWMNYFVLVLVSAFVFPASLTSTLVAVILY